MNSRACRPRPFRARRPSPQWPARPRLMPEALEGRLLFSVPEPNNTFDQAYTPPDNIYLEQNYTPTDAVNASTDVDDYYKFYSLYGTSSLHAVLGGLSADADLYVYDQDHNLLGQSRAGGNVSETVDANIPAFRYFYVRVNAYSGATNYSLYLYNDYAGSALPAARDLGASWGQSNSQYWAYNQITLNDYMDFRDNVDLFRFRMEAPGTVSLRRLPTQDPGGGALATNLQLLDSSGTVLANGVNSNNALNIDRYTLPAGTYYAKLAQSAGSGNYQLRITSDYAGDTTATARDLGDVTNSARQEFDMVGAPFLPTYEDALDLYKFTLNRPTPLDLRMTIPAFFAPPTFDADLFLARDTNGNGFIDAGEVVNQSANTGDDSLHYDSLAAGTYYAGVRQHGAYTGYQLDLDSDVDVPLGSPTPYKDMSRAQDLGVLTGNDGFDGGFGVSAGDFTDFYKFTLPAAATVTVGAANNGYWSRDPYTPYVSILRDANGNGINDAGESLAAASGSVSGALPAGTYYLSVAGNGQTIAYFGQITADAAGNNLAAARAMDAVAGATPPQQVFRDYIEQDFGGANDVDDFYKFTLPDTYTATLTTSGVEGEDLSLSLVKDVNGNGVVDAGDVLATSDAPNSPNESITRSLGAGTYYARVHGVNGATNYTLTANFVGSSVPAAPKVQQVYVAGTAWSTGYQAYLASHGLGASPFGFSVGGGATQLTDLPWNNIDQISVRFSGDVQADAADLTVHGINVANYPVTTYAYDSVSHTATWTLGRSLANDAVTLNLDGDAPGGIRAAGGPAAPLLDGEWSTGGIFPSGNGAGGGDFSFRINALPGDADRAATRRVTSLDLGYVKARANRTATEVPPAGLQPYTPTSDLNGDGRINAIDLGVVKSRLNNAVPPAPAVATAGTGGPGATRDFFGAVPIL